MLVKQYNLRADVGNEEYPFCICNVKPKIYKRLDYAEPPTPEEMEAPALEIIPMLEDKEKFYTQLSTGYVGDDECDAPIGDEIMEAMRGQSKDWKVIRCGMMLCGLVFVIVNPKVYASGVKIEPGDELYGSYDAELEGGEVYIWLDRETAGDTDFKLKVKRYNKKGKLKTFHKYRIAAWSYSVKLTEYDKHFIRISEIKYETKGDEDNKIHVKEFYG